MIVDGSWGSWGQWTECKCDPGKTEEDRIRIRECDSPRPSGGGDSCGGDAKKEEKCQCKGLILFKF